jgi:hypothetical protein
MHTDPNGEVLDSRGMIAANVADDYDLDAYASDNMQREELASMGACDVVWCRTWTCVVRLPMAASSSASPKPTAAQLQVRVMAGITVSVSFISARCVIINPPPPPPRPNQRRS